MPSPLRPRLELYAQSRGITGPSAALSARLPKKQSPPLLGKKKHFSVLFSGWVNLVERHSEVPTSGRFSTAGDKIDAIVNMGKVVGHQNGWEKLEL